MFGKLISKGFLNVLKTFLHGQMTEKIASKVGPQKSAKIVKNRFFKMLFVTTSQNINQNPEPFLESSFLKVF